MKFIVFYENFIKLCNSVNKSPSAVAIELNISKSLVSRWKKGGGVTDSTAQKIADYFGVSVSDLLTVDKKEKLIINEDDELSKEELLLISSWRQASEDDREVVVAALRKYGMRYQEDQRSTRAG